MMGGVGFGALDALVLFPFDHDHVLAMSGTEPGLDKGSISAERVWAINLAIARGCRRFVNGARDALLLSVVRAAGLLSSEWEPKFRLG
jgi:hypothetical protein